MMCNYFLLQIFFLVRGITSVVGSTNRIYAAGSGSDMLSQPETVQEIIALSAKASPSVLYLGTASYDEPSSRERQTAAFVAASCSVATLDVAWLSPSIESMRAFFIDADLSLVSGGNTLFARDRWVSVGIDKLLHEAAANGTVLSGGSAGAIVWFDGGHSDSMSQPPIRIRQGLSLIQTCHKKGGRHGLIYVFQGWRWFLDCSARTTML